MKKRVFRERYNTEIITFSPCNEGGMLLKLGDKCHEKVRRGRKNDKSNK